MKGGELSFPEKRFSKFRKVCRRMRQGGEEPPGEEFCAHKKKEDVQINKTS